MLLVNRYDRPLTLSIDLRRPCTLRPFRYTREAIPTADRGLVSPGAHLDARPGTLSVETEAESFLLLTEIE